VEDFRVESEAATDGGGYRAVAAAVPDVLYLDIQLGTRSGFEVLDGLRDIASTLVCVHDRISQYPVRAFEDMALITC